MLFTKSRTIKVVEYTRGSVTTSHARLTPTGIHSDFHFNGWRLAQGVAMTICSRHINQPEYWFYHISSLLSLSNLIDSHQPNVRIKSSRISSLRDFSRTSRIGEMSQGLVYLYMQNTGFPYVNDFHFFCYNNQITIPYLAPTPDFVCQDRNLANQICLVESKGKETISSGGVKVKLAKAINQCVSGESIINASGNYNVIKYLGFCSEWSDENDPIDSVLHFVDPDEEVRQQETNSAPMRFHYAAWFYMIGDFENAQKLVRGEKINLNEKYFQKHTVIDKKKYWILQRFPYNLESNLQRYLYYYILEEFLFFHPAGITIGISDEIIERLISQNYKEISEIIFSNESIENFEFFSDGTLIIKPVKNE